MICHIYLDDLPRIPQNPTPLHLNSVLCCRTSDEIDEADNFKAFNIKVVVQTDMLIIG